jgi:acetolactate synthase-1/3 small subunit
MSKHVFVAFVEDKPGVLNRVASLFRRRAFNIESLTVGHTEQSGVSRMTIVVEADDVTARRIEANLYKLVNVMRVDDVTQQESVIRDLALIKVACHAGNRTEVLQLVEVFRARVIDVDDRSLIIEVTGTEEKLGKAEAVFRAFGIIEMVRTGIVAMSRGPDTTSANPPLVAAVAEDSQAKSSAELAMSV